MLAIEIDRIKRFMQKLLIQNTFDSFLVSKITITTFAAFSIDGTYHPDFFSEEDGHSHESYTPWPKLKPICLQLIRGNNTPLSFQFVFVLPKSGMEALLRTSGISADPEEIQGMFLNCLFQNGKLLITNGISSAHFLSDKALERLWDTSLQDFLRKADLL